MESLGTLVAERLINIDLVDKTLGILCNACVGEIQNIIPGDCWRNSQTVPARIFSVAGRKDRLANDKTREGHFTKQRSSLPLHHDRKLMATATKLMHSEQVTEHIKKLEPGLVK